MHDADSIASLGLFHVMRRQHDRDAVVLAQMLEVVPELAARRGIEPGAGLVEQQQLGLVQKRFGQLDAPLKPAGQGLDPVARARGQAQPLEHRRTALAQARAGDSI